MIALRMAGGVLALLAILGSTPGWAKETWVGKRISASPTSNGIKCNPTAVRVTTDGSQATARLTYNGAKLRGIASSGGIEMNGGTGTYTYTFKGRIAGTRMSGTWSERTSGCKGNWFADRQR